MINTIFGPMDESLFDYHLDVIDNENELTQCPEYRLREPYDHDGKTRNGDAPPVPAGTYPVGTLVHRSVHVQLKKNPLYADAAVASF